MVMVDDGATHIYRHVGLPLLFILRRIQHQIVHAFENDGLTSVLVTGPYELHSVSA